MNSSKVNLVRVLGVLGLLIGLIISSCGRKNYGYFSSGRSANSDTYKGPDTAINQISDTFFRSQATILSFSESIKKDTATALALANLNSMVTPTAKNLSRAEKINLNKSLKVLFRNKTSTSEARQNEIKSQSVATLLCLFLGFLGIHRLYLRYKWQGILQLLLLLLSLFFPHVFIGLFVWILIDLIRILFGNLQPKDGPYGKTF